LATDPNLVFPVGNEAAPFSAVRHSVYIEANAFIPPRSFGCGCAALTNLRVRRSLAMTAKCRIDTRAHAGIRRKR